MHPGRVRGGGERRPARGGVPFWPGLGAGVRDTRCCGGPGTGDLQSGTGLQDHPELKDHQELKLRDHQELKQRLELIY